VLLNKDVTEKLDTTFERSSLIKSMARQLLVILYKLRFPNLKVGVHFRLGLKLNITKVNVSFGDYCYLGPRANISNPLSVANMVLISSDFSVIGNDHGMYEVGVPMRIALPSNVESLAITTIEDEVWIGQGVTILAGVTIGKGSIIGASSFVNKDIPPYSIGAGIPAKVIKQRFNQSDIVTHEASLYEHG